MTPLTITAADDYRLRGAVFEPDEPCGITALLAPAIFVRQRFYFACARHFAAAGLRVITWSSRGMGLSRRAETRPWKHRLEQWAQLDLAAVVAHARESRSDHRLFAVGHSMGGQLLGLTPAIHELEGVVTVASTEAWWGHWPFPQRLGILGWFGVVPILGRTLGHFPAELVRFGPDVDSAIARDWARWGRTRGYLFESFGLRSHMEDYRGGVLAYSFADDEFFGCSRAVDALHERYRRATVVRRHVDPAQLGLRGLGHFGWYREGVGDGLRAEALRWMEGRVR